MTRAADAGVCALLPKVGSLPNVLHALRTARRGSFVVDQSLLQTLITRGTEDDPARHTPLSDRETEVLALMAEGVDARRAAQRLDISIHTFRGHVRHVLSKLDAHSQLEAVAIAKREGLLSMRRTSSVPEESADRWAVRSAVRRFAIGATVTLGGARPDLDPDRPHRRPSGHPGRGVVPDDRRSPTASPRRWSPRRSATTTPTPSRTCPG